MTFNPMSSHSRNSSITSSNRSAATRGSHQRFGRLARTESAASSTSDGTNGYGTSHCHHASIAPAPSIAQKFPHPTNKNLRLLDLRMVPGMLDQCEARAWDQPGIGATVLRRHDAVTG